MNIYTFSVYSHQLVIKETLVTRNFIVIRDKKTKAIILWTDFHKYITGSRLTNLKAIQSDHKIQFTYVTKLLNYVFFEKHYVNKLSDITIEMIKEFLINYGMKSLPEDDDNCHRQKDTVKKCQDSIMNFIISLIRKEKLNIKESDLYTVEEVFSKRRKRMVTKMVPVFNVPFCDSADSIIFRDIPEKAFKIIFDVIATKYKRLLMLVCLSAFAGLRPSEACNVLRADSKLGAGIRFDLIDGEVVNVFIDLTKKRNIRSDLKNVGGIKRYREQKVYPAFLKAFYECYLEYMKYIEGWKYEEAYGPLTVNRQGKAMTYDTYRKEFHAVVIECIPLMLRSEDPEIVNYGFLLQEQNISPHIFRHWFSAKLAIYGEDVAGLMYWRGDRSPLSAITYISNKSDLTKVYASTVDKIFNYMQWKAGKVHGKDH